MFGRLPTEIVSMIVGLLFPQLGDERDRHRTAQSGLASLRRVSKLLAAAVPLQELYRFPIIDVRRYHKPLVSFLHSLHEMHSLLSAVVNLALIVSNKHTWCRQAFRDHLDTLYLTATRQPRAAFNKPAFQDG